MIAPNPEVRKLLGRLKASHDALLSRLGPDLFRLCIDPLVKRLQQTTANPLEAGLSAVVALNDAGEVLESHKMMAAVYEFYQRRAVAQLKARVND